EQGIDTSVKTAEEIKASQMAVADAGAPQDASQAPSDAENAGKSTPLSGRLDPAPNANPARSGEAAEAMQPSEAGAEAMESEMKARLAEKQREELAEKQRATEAAMQRAKELDRIAAEQEKLRQETEQALAAEADPEQE